MPFSESITRRQVSEVRSCPQWGHLELSHQLQWSQDVTSGGIYLREFKLYESLNASTGGFRNEVVWDALMTHLFLDYLGISAGCVGLQQAKWKNQTTDSSRQIICCSQAMTVLEGAKGLSALFYNLQVFLKMVISAALVSLQVHVCEWYQQNTTRAQPWARIPVVQLSCGKPLCPR